MTPLYEHDCDSCVFLGTFDNKDLYFCPKGMTTIIARNSSVGHDYQSGLVFADVDLHLGVAKFIAKRMGLTN
jgi:hypothetical protein